MSQRVNDLWPHPNSVRIADDLAGGGLRLPGWRFWPLYDKLHDRSSEITPAAYSSTGPITQVSPP